MKKLMHRSEGFTLIELMIVILIIAILVAIAVPVYLNSKSKAEKSTCQANVRTIDTAIESFAANADGVYPTSWVNLNTQTVLKNPSALKCPTSKVVYSGAWTNGPPPAVSCPTEASHLL